MKREQIRELVQNKEVIVLLDVDGVINSTSNNDFKTSYKGLPVNVSKEVLDFLSDLQEGCPDNAAVFWLTTWCEEAELLFINSSPSLPIRTIPGWTSIIERKEISEYSWPGWFKTGVVHCLQQLNPEALIVWVDDELQGVSHDFVSLNEDNIMRIAPDFETGLETKHINLIKLLLGMHKTSKKDRSRL